MLLPSPNSQTLCNRRELCPADSPNIIHLLLRSLQICSICSLSNTPIDVGEYMCNFSSTLWPTDRHTHLSSPRSSTYTRSLCRRGRHVHAACVGRRVILSSQGFITSRLIFKCCLRQPQYEVLSILRRTT